MWKINLQPTIEKDHFKILFYNYATALFKREQLNYPIAIWQFDMKEMELPFNIEIIESDFEGIRRIQKNQLNSQIVIVDNFTKIPNKILMKLVEDIQNEQYNVLFIFNDKNIKTLSPAIADKMIHFCIK